MAYRFLKNFRSRMHEVIFEADTFAGKAFDIILLIAILFSVLVVMLESVKEFSSRYSNVFLILEWSFTILFTVEYLLRLFCIHKPLRYAFSFFGLIDFISTIPTWLSLFFPGSHQLIILRVFRLLRAFRIFGLSSYLSEALTIVKALKQSARKITVFLAVVLMISFCMGSLLYWVEGPENGFTSIPRSIYWAIVTLTTVGYGDISPKTALGQTLASAIMIMGYGILAVPTGIVSAQMVKIGREDINTQSCPGCGQEGHDTDAKYCRFCGASLNN